MNPIFTVFLFLVRHMAYNKDQNQSLLQGETERAEEIGRWILAFCQKRCIPIPSRTVLGPTPRAHHTKEAIHRGMGGNAPRKEYGDPRYGDRNCGKSAISDNMMAKLVEFSKVSGRVPDRELVYNDDPEIRRVAQAFGEETAEVLTSDILTMAHFEARVSTPVKAFSILGVGHSPRWEIAVANLATIEGRDDVAFSQHLLLQPGEVLFVKARVDLSVDSGMITIMEARNLHHNVG